MIALLLHNAGYILGGLGYTILMALFSALGGTTLGIATGIVRHLRLPYAGELATAYVTVIRGTPLLVVLLVCYFALPALLGYRTTAFSAAVLAFVLFSGAYIAEDVRAGLDSVPRGLDRAALALGLRPVRVLLHVRLPIALRASIPALFNQYVRLFKYTSVASVIGVTELTGRAMLVNARELQPVLILALLAALYFVFCHALSLLGRALHARLA